MCFSTPDIPPPPPPPAPPPPPLPTAERAVTQRGVGAAAVKKRRGTQQLTVRRPSVSMGGAAGQTGVQLSQ
jgi:hypothetical protein